MKHRLFLLQYKAQIGALLAVLIIIIIANCIYSQKNIDHMDTSITSIYKDRLLASTYISELTHQLYELKLEANGTHGTQQHKEQISTLISKFESTFLTKQETLYWKAFKDHLHRYDTDVAHGSTGEQDFKMALVHLKLLTQVQAKEGSVIFRDVQADISASSLGWSLEISLSIIIGVIVLALIGISKSSLLPARQNPSLN